MMCKKCFLQAVILCAAIFMSGCSSLIHEKNEPEPRPITLWNYYNGDQLTAFNALVDEFNATVGKQHGIIVESTSQGTIDDLAENVTAAARGDAGAEELPNILSAYSDAAYELDRLGCVASLDSYISTDERNSYIDTFLEEGRFDGEEIKIFPIAKSVEVLVLNQTDWEKFASATGATYENLATMEGITATAESYFEWTDSLTSEPLDGKSFFGRDAMANYFLAGSMQMGAELVCIQDGQLKLNFEREVARRLWDNYYVPYIKGYFSSSGRFRSDDLKIGNILACICSSSSATFLPDKVSTSDTEEHPIKIDILPCPKFQDSLPYAIQQGAGMVVTTGETEEIEASVVFLKWLTSPEHNIGFSAGSGYVPVKKSANDMAVIRSSGLSISDSIDKVLEVSVNTVNNDLLYVAPVHHGSCEVRRVLEHSLKELAEHDRTEVKCQQDLGKNMEESTAPFLTDQYFEAWYRDTVKRLQRMIT